MTKCDVAIQPEQDVVREASALTWIVPVAVIVTAVVLYFVWPAYTNFVDRAYAVLTSNDADEIEAWVDQYGGWGPAVILAGMFMQTLLAVIPSIMLMVVAVLAYGPLWGGLLAWGGVTAAALLAFGIGRAVGVGTVERFMGTRTRRKMERAVNRYGIGAIIAARIESILSTDAVSFVAGLVCMKLWHFLLATAIGTAPLAILTAWLGQDWRRTQTGLAIASVISIAAIVGYAVYDDRRRRAADEETSHAH